jgi:hypothetical protein
MGIQRVLRDVQAQPEVTFFTGSTPVEADGAVTVDIFRGDGTTFATDAATTDVDPNVGLYRYTLAAQSNLERFRFVWEGAVSTVVQRVTTYVEIVGGYVASLTDIKAETGLSTKTDAQLIEARQWFEDIAESWCGVAFVPRYGRDVLDGSGSEKLKLSHSHPRTILSAKVDGVAQTGTATWDLYDSGVIIRDSGSFPVGRRNVEIIYEHGYDAPEAEVREAALIAIRSKLLSAEGGTSGGIPSGVTQLITDAGTMIFGRRPTGPFPNQEVNDALAMFRAPMVA